MENKEIKNEVVLPKFQMYTYPYERGTETTSRVMLDVIIALIPAIIGSIYFFGIKVIPIYLVSILSCVLTEYIIQKVRKVPVKISDLSSVVTGILIAMNVPSEMPLYMMAFAGIFAVGVCKEAFGGIGSNFVNPALGGRTFLMASWGAAMTNYIAPGVVDGVASATPLQLLAEGATASDLPTIKDMFIGNINGVIGETSALLLLIGAIYLIIKKQIDIKIPLVYILSSLVLLPLFGVSLDLAIYYLLGGGLIMGAFFMATDYVTCPTTDKGKIIFAIGCGVITTVIRVFGNMPEGVSYSILFMNCMTPMIDKYIQPRVFGEVKDKNER